VTLKLSLEIKNFLKANSSLIIGVDEVGRGCIAGPVCAGVVIFRPESKSKLSCYVDSKTISEEKREALALEIQNEHHCALGWSSVEEVDELNIRQASLLAMKRAIELLITTQKIKTSECIVLVDGRDTVPNLASLQQRSVIKGDQHVRQISAASIVAKVARDQLMKEFSITHTEYGFENHKGYGTEEHRNAIKKYGITSLHRKTFGGVKEYI
jgi:ribonuclease HII